MTITRRDAFRVAADVLERSDWLATDLLADEGDEHASENADRIVEILREEVARMGQAVVRIADPFGYPPRVTATAPPPSGAAGATTPSVSDGAPTYATGGYVGPVDGTWIRDTLRAASDRAHALPAYARPTVTRPVSGGVTLGQPTISVTTRATSGPLDPEVHAALVRSVERGRREDRGCRIPECYCPGDVSHP